jgi:hypothetical protein
MIADITRKYLIAAQLSGLDSLRRGLAIRLAGRRKLSLTKQRPEF